MDKATLRKLASMTIVNGSVDEKLRDFVLSRLSKADLKEYLFFLKNIVRARQVYIRTPGAPDAAARTRLQSIFKDKKVHFETVDTMGAGIQVEWNDNIVNYNLKNLIERTISTIKETL